jgi:mRNA interferase MazF
VARQVARGEIWLYRFAPPDKRRPVLVLSRDAALRYLRTATVAPISTTIHGVASEVVVGVEHGLKSPCAVNLDHIITVPQSDLRRYVGHLDQKTMSAVCHSAGLALGCG